MTTIDLRDTPYRGSTSRLGARLTIDSSCRRCGSDLRGRYEGTFARTIAAVDYTVYRWRCACGAGREVRKARL